MFAPRYAEFPSDNFCYKGRRAERVQLPFSFQPSRSHGGHGSGQDGVGEPGGGHRQLQQERTEEEEEEEDKQLWTNSFPGKKMFFKTFFLNIFLSYLSGLKILYICRPSSILASMYTVH